MSTLSSSNSLTTDLLKVYQDGAKYGSWEVELDWTLARNDASQGDRLVQATELASMSCHVEQIGMRNAALLMQRTSSYEFSLLLAQAVADEARHANAFARYLEEMNLAIAPPGQDPDDLTAYFERTSSFEEMLLGHAYLEALALEEFGILIDAFEGMFIADIYKHVRVDEARHVAGALKYLAIQIAADPALATALQEHLVKNLPVLCVGETGVAHLAKVSGLETIVIQKRIERRTENFMSRLAVH